MPETREWIHRLGPDVRVAVTQRGRRSMLFSVRLEVRRDGHWVTIRQIDNHHEEGDVAHLHRYNGTAKQDPEHWTNGPATETMAKAIRYMIGTWQPILESWEGTK